MVCVAVRSCRDWNADHGPWYTKGPMGERKINSMLDLFAAMSGVSHKTLHAARKTQANTLKKGLVRHWFQFVWS